MLAPQPPGTRSVPVRQKRNYHKRFVNADHAAVATTQAATTTTDDADQEVPPVIAAEQQQEQQNEAPQEKEEEHAAPATTSTPLSSPLPSYRLAYILECDRLGQHINRSLAMQLPRLDSDVAVILSQNEKMQEQLRQTLQKYEKKMEELEQQQLPFLGSVSASVSPVRQRLHHELPASSSNTNNSPVSPSVRGTSSSTGLHGWLHLMSPNASSSSTRRSPPFAIEQQQQQNEVESQHILTTLDCSRNFLGEKGLVALLPVLRRAAPTLKYLLLNGCGLTTISVMQLLEILESSQSLKELDLRNNFEIDQQAGKMLQKMVNQRFALFQLAVTHEQKEEQQQVPPSTTTAIAFVANEAGEDQPAVWLPHLVEKVVPPAPQSALALIAAEANNSNDDNDDAPAPAQGLRLVAELAARPPPRVPPFRVHVTGTSINAGLIKLIERPEEHQPRFALVSLTDNDLMNKLNRIKMEQQCVEEKNNDVEAQEVSEWAELMTVQQDERRAAKGRERVRAAIEAPAKKKVEEDAQEERVRHVKEVFAKARREKEEAERKRKEEEERNKSSCLVQ